MILYESNYYGVQAFGDSLEHHGIKGQKWGVRRFQNEDGSLTAAGKARYGTEENFNKAQKYKSGLRDATVAGGLVGRAIYKSRHKNDEGAAIERAAKKNAKPQHSDEYKKGLRRATLEGGLIGRQIYKSKHKNDDVSSAESTAKEKAPSRKEQKEAAREKYFSSDGKMKIMNTDTAVTRQVKKDYNELSDREFIHKYSASKKDYAKRVEKHGDPYKWRMEKSKGKYDRSDAEVELRSIKSSHDRANIKGGHKISRKIAKTVTNKTANALSRRGANGAANVVRVAGAVGRTKDRIKEYGQLKSEKQQYKKDVEELRKKHKGKRW